MSVIMLRYVTLCNIRRTAITADTHLVGQSFSEHTTDSDYFYAVYTVLTLRFELVRLCRRDLFSIA